MKHFEVKLCQTNKPNVSKHFQSLINNPCLLSSHPFAPPPKWRTEQNSEPPLSLDDRCGFNPAPRSDWLPRCYAAGQLCAARALRVRSQAGCLLLHHHQRASLCRLRGTPESCGAQQNPLQDTLFSFHNNRDTTDTSAWPERWRSGPTLDHFRHFLTTFSVTESTGRRLRTAGTAFVFPEPSQ